MSENRALLTLLKTVSVDKKRENREDHTLGCLWALQHLGFDATPGFIDNGGLVRKGGFHRRLLILETDAQGRLIAQVSTRSWWGLGRTRIVLFVDRTNIDVLAQVAVYLEKLRPWGKKEA